MGFLNPKRERQVGFAVLLAFFWGCLFFIYLELRRIQIHDLISVGMTVDDVIDRLGEPSHVSKKGEPLVPLHVSGFSPHRENTNVVYSYQWRLLWVYIFFNEDKRVAAYYVCRP